MAKIIITGAKGQLGQSLLDEAVHFPEHTLVGYDIAELDIFDVDAVYQMAQKQKTDVVVNCAAYTAVEKAENNPSSACLINAKAVEGLVKVCSILNLFLVHLSTDYVFDGTSALPYKECEIPRPLSIYGASKLEGERFVLHYGRGMVVRTSWLFAPKGQNFVTTILRHGVEKDKIEVVDDQTGSPTYAPHLAYALLKMVGRITTSQTPEQLMGLYHLSNGGSCSWYEFAKKIKEISGFRASIVPVQTSSYPSAVKRPAYSVLNCSKVARTFGVTLPEWRVGISDFFHAQKP